MTDKIEYPDWDIACNGDPKQTPEKYIRREPIVKVSILDIRDEVEASYIGKLSDRDFAVMNRTVDIMRRHIRNGHNVLP